MPVLITVDGPIGTVTLNRPEAFNAITIELAQALERGLRELGGDPSVGAIVIRGAGGNFSVGGDFKQLERLRAAGVDAMRELFESFHRACGAIAELSVPVIAAVEGHACAGGFELVLASDIVLVRDDAKLSDIHSNHGMVPGGGSTQRLPRLVGPQRALALILSGDRLSGTDAVQWGLAYRAFGADAFESGVAEFAATLAAKNRTALQRSKRLIRDGLERPLGEGLELELESVLEHLSGPATFAMEAG
ncbi:MAG TPA: enoyl-CoA hydratase/isomerase family protein [Solirubrobacteraceae bacterium]|nr:enoyl-CoA hydratase/isomerase family protein [Solirubrobacteraceae bacterium]